MLLRGSSPHNLALPSTSVDPPWGDPNVLVATEVAANALTDVQFLSALRWLADAARQ